MVRHIDIAPHITEDEYLEIAGPRVALCFGEHGRHVERVVLPAQDAEPQLAQRRARGMAERELRELLRVEVAVHPVFVVLEPQLVPEAPLPHHAHQLRDRKVVRLDERLLALGLARVFLRRERTLEADQLAERVAMGLQPIGVDVVGCRIVAVGTQRSFERGLAWRRRHRQRLGRIAKPRLALRGEQFAVRLICERIALERLFLRRSFGTNKARARGQRSGLLLDVPEFSVAL